MNEKVELTMKKSFMLEELDCAHCAAKMEDAIRKLEGVSHASVNFMLQKLTLEADDSCFETVLDEAAAIIRKIEPDCRIVR